MLELYKDGQPIFYNMVNNAIKNNKLSHAYIFDSNGNPDVMDIVLSFVKYIFSINSLLICFCFPRYIFPSEILNTFRVNSGFFLFPIISFINVFIPILYSLQIFIISSVE